MSPGRPRNAAATRQAIKLAAQERFGSDGYKKATVRAIAADAGIDPAMVIRYFGSKEGLLAEAADFDLRLPEPSGISGPDAGHLLAEHFLTRWEQDGAFTALLHAAASHDVARRRLHVVFEDQVAAVVAALSPDAASAGARAGLIASHVLGIALCRYVVMLPPICDMPRAELTAWLGATLQRYLTADAPA